MVTVATLMAGVCWIAAPPARAQPADPPESHVATARSRDGEEAAPVERKWDAEPPASPENATPYRPPGFPKIVLLDVGHVLTSPFRWRGREWAAFSASVGALAALSLADESISDAAREHGPTFGFAGDTLAGMSDGRSFLLLGGFYLAGAIGHDSKAKNVFFDGLSASLIASGIITPVISTLVGRERPTAEQGPYSFHPFEGRSFPSGHATQAFAVASVIATSYDPLWVKVAAYAAASAGSYARVRIGKHFLTDIVAGAAIGTLVGRSVVHLNRKLRSGEREPESTALRVSILPFVAGTTFGATASLDF